MPQPLDIVLGATLSKARTDAIEAVRLSDCKDENSIEFWDRVSRVQDICARWQISAPAAAQALDVLAPFLSCDGEYGRMMVTDSDLNRLVVAIARVHK